MATFYTAAERVHGPARRGSGQWLGTVAATGERSGSPVYSVAVRHRASGKPWMLHGVRETVPRFYKADGGRWRIGDQVIVVRAASSVFEIVGAAPDGRQDDAIDLSVGGSSIEIDGAAASGGITVQAGDTSQRTAPDGYTVRRTSGDVVQAEIAVTEQGPYLASGRWAARDRDGRQETRGLGPPPADEADFHVLLLDPEGVAGFDADPAERGYRLPLTGAISVSSGDAAGPGTHSHSVVIALDDHDAWSVLPARLSRANVVAEGAAGGRGALPDALGALPAPYAWAEPALSAVSVDLFGRVDANVTAALPPEITAGDVRIRSVATPYSTARFDDIVGPHGSGRRNLITGGPTFATGLALERSVANGLLFRYPTGQDRDWYYWVAATHETTFSGRSVPATAFADRDTFLAAARGAGLRADAQPSDETGYLSCLVGAYDVQGRVLPSAWERYSLAIFRAYP